MHIDRDRGCCRISFEHREDLNTLQKNIETCGNQIDGFVSGGDLLREGDHYVLCVHHQESLKSYFEHEIFDLATFLVFTERLRRLLGDLHRNKMDIYDGVWDVDCIFVGTGMEDVSFVYIPGFSKMGDCRFFRVSDLLAVLSLRVYETDLQALQALSNVIGAFSMWEDTVLLQSAYSETPFDLAHKQLGPFCANAHPLVEGVKRIFYTLTETRGEEKHAGRMSAVSRPRRKKVRIQLEGLGMLKGRNLCLDLESHFTQDGNFSLGRDPNQVGFLIPYPVVSRRQASFSYDKGEWILTDHHSANGTFIDDVKMAAGSGYPLIQGACIFFAHKEIGFRVRKV